MGMAGPILDQLILVANPGSASRKYGLYSGDLTLLAELHFEIVDGKVSCSLHRPGEKNQSIAVDFDSLEDSATHLSHILENNEILPEGSAIASIGLRIVAPSAYFMQDHVMTDEVVGKLRELQHLAPLHITSTLQELASLQASFPDAKVVGVSDSAFHRTKPNYAWNYGIKLEDADRLDVKRFGYHGISVASSIDTLWDSGKLPPKVIVCHLGSGSSVTGVFHGRSIDTSMGFTPNEGVIMATRSGAITPDAAYALQQGLKLDEQGLEQYLNAQSGLLGLSGSNDIRELINREADGDHIAHLALTTLIHSIHKSIGAMLVAMNGADLIVFTGTVGERSAILRKRIIAHLEFADFIIDGDKNDACIEPEVLTTISQSARSRPIMVIPTNESLEIAKHTKKL
jgi:acetate kinase